MNPCAGRDGEGWRERIGLSRVRDRGHDAQVFPKAFLMGNVDIVELRRVVVASDAGKLLKMTGLEFNDGGGGEAMRLLAPRDDGLPKETADRFAHNEATMARTCG